MRIESVFDKSFSIYGQIVTGHDEAFNQILEGMKNTPCNDGVDYVPEDKNLQSLPAADVVSTYLYGGMPCQLGWCNGHNTKMNCLEYHRDSEFDLAATDLVLLLAKREEMVDGYLDTSKVKAYLVPSGTMVELYASTLHFAPCQASKNNGFKMMVALPKGTNYDKPQIEIKNKEDELLWGSNKWLLCHKDSKEASMGGAIRLNGINVDIIDLI